jgi:di/tricarboxylate transporter
MTTPSDEDRSPDLRAEPNPKQSIAAAIFVFAAIALSFVVPSVEIAWVTAILLLTIYLFAFEVVAVDVAAVTVMVLLGLSSLFYSSMGLEAGLVDIGHLFDGFASNAVMSIIAVMIIGAGLDKTGIMSKVATFILKVGGTTETRIIPIISATVGIISSFMQNVGAAALFLPVVARISARSGLPLSRLLMPMGFCAILGGTVTMVGSSPLILLNDLILASNQALPAEQQMQPWGLFSVTPVGLALLAAGIAYFVLAGRFVLPTTKSERTKTTNIEQYFRDTYGFQYCMKEMVIPKDSKLVGRPLFDVEHDDRVRVVAMQHGGDLRIGRGALAGDIPFEADSVIGIVASPGHCKEFAQHFGLEVRQGMETFGDALSATKAGIAEVVIPPGSQLIGKSARDLWMRHTYGLTMVALHRGGTTTHKGEGMRDMPLQAGDTLLGYIAWDSLTRLEKDRNFVVVTTEYPHEELRPHKVIWAGFFFTIALSMVLFTDLRLSVALLTGAIGMVLSGVLKMEEAYDAVSWKTVFLLASLIPLGLAVETTGTARWIAEGVVALVGGAAPWVIQAAIAALATFFTLVMSNVGATVLLVPLAVNIAVQVGADPAVYALTVAIATSNSFLIPTHQVNALIMGPGGYRVADFMRAGGVMTVLFLVVSIAMLNLVF